MRILISMALKLLKQLILSKLDLVSLSRRILISYIFSYTLANYSIIIKYD